MTNGIIQQGLVYKSQKGTPVTTSLLVAEKFGKEHRNVMRDIRNLLNKDVLKIEQMFYDTQIADSYGRMQDAFVMNKDGFSLLVMGFTGKEALKFKVDYINAFNQMEHIIKDVAQHPAIPQTLSEALRLAADQAEQIEQQQKQIEAQRPRVLFSQSVETSKDSVLIGELAKIICQNGIETGEKRLFQWLRENNYLCSHGERYNQPTQRAIELGLFEIRKTTINVGESTKVRTTTKVTGKGQIYFVNKLLYNNQLSTK